jgi:hypothetical protein
MVARLAKCRLVRRRNVDQVLIEDRHQISRLRFREDSLENGAAVQVDATYRRSSRSRRSRLLTPAGSILVGVTLWYR